jgi:hypothetical protein
LAITPNSRSGAIRRLKPPRRKSPYFNGLLVLLARLVNGADTDNSLWNQPESAGLKAIATGFRKLGFKDDHELNTAEWIVYDALYAYCQEMVAESKVHGMFL